MNTHAGNAADAAACEALICAVQTDAVETSGVKKSGDGSVAGLPHASVALPETEQALVDYAAVAVQMVSVEVLNSSNRTVAHVEARLLHLHADWATLQIVGGERTGLIHWATWVRFRVRAGSHGYVAQGLVVACDDEAAPAGQERAAGTREIIVRLRQCSSTRERRAGSRRWQRFGVRVLPVDMPDRVRAAQAAMHRPQAAADSMQSDLAKVKSVASPTVHAMHCWAVDISAKGVRLRLPCALVEERRVGLQFWLPDNAANQAATHAHCFAVQGRVVRCTSAQTRGVPAWDAMVCFDTLAPADERALHHFVEGDAALR